MDDDGSAVITKVDSTGGAVTLMTIKEQILYEVHDPSQYITPDVVCDFTTVDLAEVGLRGTRRRHLGKAAYADSEGIDRLHRRFYRRGHVFYAGPGALRRAELAKRVLEERFKIVKLNAEEIRIDFVGLNAIHGPISPKDQQEPYEIAVRVAARTKTRAEAATREPNGPAMLDVGGEQHDKKMAWR